jgi:hypothetical protein
MCTFDIDFEFRKQFTVARWYCSLTVDVEIHCRLNAALLNLLVRYRAGCPMLNIFPLLGPF